MNGEEAQQMFPPQQCVGLLRLFFAIKLETKKCRNHQWHNANANYHENAPRHSWMQNYHQNKHNANQHNVTTWEMHIPSREFSRSSTLSSAREISSARNRSPLFIASIKGPSTHSNNLEGSTFWKQTKLFTIYSNIYGWTYVNAVSLIT